MGYDDDDYEAEQARNEAQIARAKAILAEHGIGLSIGGCGCCGSPWVRMTYKDEKVIFDPEHEDRARDSAGFDTFDPAA